MSSSHTWHPSDIRRFSYDGLLPLPFAGAVSNHFFFALRFMVIFLFLLGLGSEVPTAVQGRSLVSNDGTKTSGTDGTRTIHAPSYTSHVPNLSRQFTARTVAPFHGVPGAYFPPHFGPLPPAGREDLPDPVEDWDVIIFYYDFTREDLIHSPFALSFLLEMYGDLKPSHYTRSGMYVGSEERVALQAHREKKRHVPLRLKRKTKKTAHNSMHSYRKEEEFDIYMETHLSPHEILPQLIQGHYVGDGVHPAMMDVLDRYFVHQMELSPVLNHFCDYFVEMLHMPDRPPLQVTMHSWLTSRFGLRCLYLRTPELLTATRKFVLVSPEGDNCCGNSFDLDEVLVFPAYTIDFLLNHPLLLHWYGMNGEIRHPKFTPTPIGSRPFHRSGTSLTQNSFEEHQHNVRQNAFTQLYLMGLDLNQLFPHIPHELHYGRVGCVWLEKALELFAGRTIDPPVEWIPFDQLPERVTTIYIIDVATEKRLRPERPSYLDEVMIIHDEPGNRAAAAAQHAAFLPFTAALYHKLYQHPFGAPEREDKIIRAFTVWDWRRDIFEYLSSPAMASHVYTVPSTFHDEFAHILNNYTFVMSPAGFGYDCYRTWEALSYGAIPIVQGGAWLEKMPFKYNAAGWHPEALVDVFQELPVVIVSHLSEITVENMTKWKREIHDKFVRGEYKIEKIFAQYWFDRFSSHTNDE